MDLRLTVIHIDRLLNFPGSPAANDIRELIKEIISRYRDELTGRAFYALSADRAAFYEDPLDKWDAVINRFGCAFDVEEARKCFALERSTVSVFHLMRVTEAAVLELQVFIGGKDLKAHFGSVVSRVVAPLGK
jgi:hypothetical protein